MNLSQMRLLCAALVALCFISIFGILHSRTKASDITWLAKYHSKLSSASNENSTTEPLAYMTFLAGTIANLSDPDISHDVYFEATRMLGYQLLHYNPTKTQANIPFVVLVTEDVSQKKRDRLSDDGATIIPVEYLIGGEWLTGPEPRWKDVVTKLRAWEMTQYSRILFIDGDTLINHCLDDIFHDPAAQFRPVTEGGQSEFENDIAREYNLQANLETDYVFASLPETQPGHSLPPSEDQYKDPHYLTAGFFLFSPSLELFNFYIALMEQPGRFDPSYPEQNLLNYAHRRDGKVPWQRLAPSWNVNFPSTSDMESGVASMHEKWWSTGVDEGVRRYMLDIRWKMESFYEGRDLGLID